ncbi:MAG: BsuPI-related putative proteinase inhibitor [Gemmatimonadaceae bacterium]
MLRSLRTRPVALFALLTASGCDAVTSLGVARDRDVEGIVVTLTVSSSVAETGDEVRLTIAAHNATDQRIELGGPCGPPLDAIITRPDGRRSSALLEMVGEDAVFTCELREHHIADPGETETMELVWRPPPQRGTYTVVGGVRATYREISNPSAPVHVVVR